MAYDEQLDARIKKVVSPWKGTASRKMFGGVCHLLNGKMFGGVHKDKLIVRLGPKEAEKALKKANVVPFDVTGKPMKGWVMIEKEAIQDDAELKSWLSLSKKFVKTLPDK